MTRRELESLGLTDAALMEAYDGYFHVKPELTGEDTPELQQRRRIVFDQVMVRAMGPHPVVNHAPLGAFGRDEPALHAAAQRHPSR